MIFTHKKTVDDIDVSIDGNNIDKVNNTKFLGVYIDHKLSWKKHVECISGKVARGIGIILKARKLLNRSALKTLYYSFVYPYFSYCNHVWGSANDTTLRPLYLLQKRVVRIICGAAYLANTDPLLIKLCFLKLHDINKYAFSKFMYRWYNNKVPDIFVNEFQYVNSVHFHETRQIEQLYGPKPRTDYGKTRFLYKCPQIWNAILKAKINPDTSEIVFFQNL